jgi:hypothetical protein
MQASTTPNTLGDNKAKRRRPEARVYGQPTAETRARARDGDAEREADVGSGRRPMPVSNKCGIKKGRNAVKRPEKAHGKSNSTCPPGAARQTRNPLVLPDGSQKTRRNAWIRGFGLERTERVLVDQVQ